MLRVEILRFPQSPKYAQQKAPDLPTQLFSHLTRTAPQFGIRVVQTHVYQGQSDWLMLYGPGGLNRVDPMQRQIRARRRVICWDAPYWHRGRKLRVSIDHAHPQRWVLRRAWPDDRLIADGITCTNLWNPDGPILLAGIGVKSQAQYGADTVRAWQHTMVAAARARWPGRPIWWRPKPNSPAPPPDGTVMAPAGPIETVLAGVSLVMTWHSNVAVDAIRAGVPVVCSDGASAAVAPAILNGQPIAPLDDAQRRRFLANLAWFQWAPSEAESVWRFLRELLMRE